MKNNSKRICALLLAIVMCIGCVVPVFAETTPHVHADVVCPGADEPHTMTNAPVKFVKTVAPKCGTFGYDLYECETCKTPVVTNWTEVGDGKDTWGEWTVVTKPTCTAYGVMERVCTNAGCGNKETINASNFAEKTALYGADVTKVIKPLDHKNADGTSAIKNDRQSGLECKDGIPEYKEWCELCDYSKPIAATPGQPCDRYVVEIVSQPNCYETGLAIVKCKNCSYCEEEVIVNATGSLAHTWDTTKTVVTTAPTCGTAGSGTIYCSVCKTTVNVVANKVNFTYVTASGVTTPVEIVLDASFGFAATGVHSFTVDVTGSPADCDDKGVKDHKKCANCDAVSLNGTTVATAAELEIAALGHTWTDVAGVAHTCVKDGVKAHAKCSVCNALTLDKTATPVVIVTEADVVDPASHDYDLSTPVASSLPSCTKYGFWFYGCGVCGMPADANGENSTTAPIPSTAPAGSEWVSNGVLRLPMLPHAWTLDATDSRNAAGDCVNDKVEVYKCTCGAEHIETTPSAGHDWETVTVKANCQHGGYKFDYCKSTLCGYTDANSDGIVDLSECVTVRVGTAAEADATKENPAANGKYDVVDAQLDVHEWDPTKTVVTTPPTCTAGGLALDWCALCGAKEEHAVPALSHNSFEFVEKIDPTCTSAGYLVYQCSLCHAASTKVNLGVADLTEDHEDYATNKLLNLAALGHELSTSVADHEDPTCSKVGYDRYECVRFAKCGHYVNKVLDDNGDELYPALNHTYPAGHAQAGQSSLYEDETLPKCDPDSADPTVGIAGYVTEKCHQCDHSVKVKDIEFVHNNAAHHPLSTVNPDTVWHDGIKYDDAAAADAAAGGTANGIYWPGSCDRERLVDYYCPNCAKTFYAADDSMVGEHTPKAGTEVSANPATCTTAGNLAHYVCEKCNNKVLINTAGEKVVYTEDSAVVIPATGHTWTDVKASAPDCTNAGTLAYSYCACGAYTLDKTANPVVTFTAAELAAKIADPAKGHAWGTIIPEVPAECNKAGTKAHYDCANCDAVSTDGIVECTAAALVIGAINHAGHMIDSALVTAKCVTPGYQYHYCDLCGYEYVDNYVYALGHVFTDVAKADETCAVAGKAAHVKCTTCGELFAEGTTDVLSTAYVTEASLVISATGKHVYADGTPINNTCAPGVDFADSATCHTCGGTVAITHTALESNEVDATCTEYGYTVTYCKDCGYEKVEKKADFAPTGHNYQWIVTTPAQMYVGGEESYKCVAGNGSAGCGHVKETRPTDPTGGIEFSYEIDNAVRSGAELVNGGKLKLSIYYKAANVDLSSIAIRLNYNADLLAYANGDFKCDSADAEGNPVFAYASVSGKTAGFVYVSANTTGWGEANADKKFNGEGLFAEIYFDVKTSVEAGTAIDFDIALAGNSASQVLKADGSSVYANFGDVAGQTTVALGDVAVDGATNSSDENKIINILFANDYSAAADINQDGIIGFDDAELIFNLIKGDITWADVYAAIVK